MKKLAVFLFLYINLSALEVSNSKTFTKHLEPAFQSGSFSISYKADYDYKIESKFKQIIEITGKSGICKGGGYYIYPAYKYIDNKRIEDGYRSNIRFECEFKNTEDYENILDEIKRSNVKIEQGNISYKTTRKQKDEARVDMEKEAFIYAKEYNKSLEEFFGKCSIESINLASDKFYPIRYKAAALESSALKTTVTSPIKEDIEYKLNVDYIFKCTQ